LAGATIEPADPEKKGTLGTHQSTFKGLVIIPYPTMDTGLKFTTRSRRCPVEQAQAHARGRAVVPDDILDAFQDGVLRCLHRVRIGLTLIGSGRLRQDLGIGPQRDDAKAAETVLEDHGLGGTQLDDLRRIGRRSRVVPWSREIRRFRRCGNAG
jgi:hypothetical protein